MAKMIFFDFLCNECGEKFEALVVPDKREATCPACGAAAVRLVSAPMLDPRMGIDLSMTTMADKWARKHEEMAKRSASDED